MPWNIISSPDNYSEVDPANTSDKNKGVSYVKVCGTREQSVKRVQEHDDLSYDIEILRKKCSFPYVIVQVSGVDYGEVMAYLKYTENPI